MNSDIFGKVAVLMGGWSPEREVSLDSGAAVLAALKAEGIDAHGIDMGRDIATVLSSQGYDRVFNIVHGDGGEDGVLQGLLDVIDMPYTGSGVMASALSMDKLMTKRIWSSAGLPTPKFLLLTEATDWQRVVDVLGLPLMVKPASSGSSIGMTKVDDVNDLQQAWQRADQVNPCVFAEQWVTGSEFTVAILDEEALPVIKLETDNAFYDYEAKYKSNDTRYLCPCGLESAAEKNMQSLSLTAFNQLKANGWGRIDIMRDEQGKDWLIELNTVPGMTSHSLVPKAAKNIGISFEKLVVKILAMTLKTSENL